MTFAIQKKSDRTFPFLRQDVVKTLISCACFFFSQAVFANPVLDNVAAGQVSIQQTPTTTTVNQTSQKAIINWQSFNIAAPETTHFQQPAGGVALNRINPAQGASQIYGRLTATGKIILVNPSGFYFGPGAYVNVGGIIASTANITNEDFLNDYYRFANVPGYNGAIVNEGQIIAAEHGLVALIGGAVRNDGMIQAELGHAVLASGESFTMAFAGDDLISFSVDTGVTSRAVDHQGNEIRDGVSHTGSIYADGGSVLISAKAASGVLDRVVNTEGLVRARSVSKSGGTITFSASPKSGVVRIASKVDASGKRSGEKGGKITVTGENILVDQSASLDVSGDAGGGQINIGGDYLGQGPLPNANAVVMRSNAEINADALSNGNGGRIILWSDHYTNISGTITATGGRTSGNGGFIETSSKNILSLGDLSISTHAAHGNTGVWLLDPTNIYIAVDQAAATTAGMTGTDSSANTGPSTFQATGAIQDSLLTTATLDSALGSSNIIVTTTNASGTGLGNITVVSPITWASTNTLTLTAANNIAINASITTGAAGSSLILNAAGSVTQTASIAGAGRLIKQGAGTAFLSLNNSYTGGTTVNSGILNVATLTNIGSASSIGTGSITPAITLDGGTLQYSGTTTQTSNRPFVLGPGGGTIDSSGSNSGGTFGYIVLNGGITGTGNALTLTGTYPLSFNRINGVISTGTGGSITKTGTGIWTLAGANSYTGAMNIVSGNLILQAANVLPSTSSILISGTGTIDLNVYNQTVASISSSGTPTGGITSSGASLTINESGTSTFRGTLGGLLGIIKAGTGTLTLTGTLNNHAGGTAIDNGVLVLSSTDTTLGSGGVTVNSGGTLRLSSSTIANTLVLNGAGAAGTNGALVSSGSSTTTGSVSLAGHTQVGSDDVFSSLHISNNSITGSGYNLTFNALGNSIISSVINTGTGSFTKNGTAVLTLSGNNSYSGATTINNGILILSHNNALGTSAATVVSGATLQIGNTINIGNALTLNGAGYAGTNGALETNYAGLATASGSITLASASSIGAYTNVTLSLANTATITASGYDLTVNGDGNSNIASIINLGTGDLIKNGAGILTLSGNNTYSGDTNINAGTLQVGSGGSTGSLGAGAVTNNAALVFNVTGNTTLASAVTGTGALTQSGSGTTILAGNNTYSGGTTINAGTLQIGNGGATGSITGNILNNGSLVVNTANSFAYNNSISGSGSLTKTGSGTLTFGGTNTYSGNTSINGGTLSIDSNANLGATPIAVSANNIQLGGGILQTNGTMTLHANRGITLTAGNNVLKSGSGALTYDGLFSGGNDLTLDGPGSMTLGGNIGSVTPLASLTVNSNLNFNNTAISTAGAQIFNGSFTLNNISDVTLTSNGGGITLNNVNWTGANSLNLHAATAIAFNNLVSATNGTVVINAPTLSASTNGYLNIHNLDMSNLGKLVNVNMSGFNDGVMRVNGSIVGQFNINNNGTITGNALYSNMLIPIQADYAFLVRTGPRSGYFTDPFIYINFIVPEQSVASTVTTASTVSAGNAGRINIGSYNSNATASNVPTTQFLATPQWLVFKNNNFTVLSNLERPVMTQAGTMGAKVAADMLPISPFRSLTVQIVNDLQVLPLPRVDQQSGQLCAAGMICLPGLSLNKTLPQ